MEGPIEDYEDGLVPDFWENGEYEDDPDNETTDDFIKAEDYDMIQSLENIITDTECDSTPTDLPRLSLLNDSMGKNIEQPQTVFLPADFKPATNISVEIPESTLIAPRYLYQGEELPIPPEREWQAVHNLLERHSTLRNGHDGFIEFNLDQFTVYIEPYVPGVSKSYEKMRYPSELRPLQHLSIKPGCSRMYIDGILSFEGTRYFIRQVPFEELPIGNYGVSEHTVGSNIWVRSSLNVRVASQHKGRDVYYRLKGPSPEYKRYYSGFLWIADLAKHVADYLSAAVAENRRIVFRDFRSEFSKWLSTTHQGSKAFTHWRAQHPSSDFCTAIVANLDFIYKETYGVLGHDETRSIYLWQEIRDYTAYTDASEKFPLILTSNTFSLRSPRDGKSSQIPKTTVTPYIDQLFSHLPFGSMMEPLRPSLKVDKLRETISRSYNLESSPSIHTSADQIRRDKIIREIRAGDVISTTRDDKNESHWAREVAIGFHDVDRWFGLVQKVHSPKNGEPYFDVIWLYRPVDTICGIMKYPWNNELFLSDHCSCKDSHPKILASEVLSIHQMDWGGSSDTNAEFFCRQTYLTGTRRWVTFQETHLRCYHNSKAFPYKVGDTLLVHLKKAADYVEPCELVALPGLKEVLTFRLLHRRDRLESQANIPPNELLYSDDTVSLKADAIHGRCLVRFFQPNELIPPPYDRKGVGNAFFITHRLQSSGQIIPMDGKPASLRQGFDPLKHVPKLRGVDLFCGGGNFGRGLEEGGAVEMKWANDINVRAIHTYMANATGTVHPFAGSIDHMQRLALEGKFSNKVPKIGLVDFVSAGSPCPGFSRLTVDKATPEQRKNQSLVAAFASFIDIYRPKFGILENVLEIVQPLGKRNEDVFCQLVCAIVGLGYQAHFSLLDAWTFGSPQSRSRVFLCFAAPGFNLPEMPLHSHSHHEKTFRSKTLGLLPNAEPMVERCFMPTPFKFVTAEEATADLPDIMDSKPDCCIAFPDHRLAYGMTRYFRNQLSVIPKQPYGMNFQTAWKNGHGTMTKAERDFFPEKGARVSMGSSRAWGRCPPGKILQTVTTTPSPADARMGRLLHWSQNRVLSIMEARRAQGFRDHEVILGQPKDQWRVIGNSVAREVSLALGLCFREAWLGSLIEGDEIEPVNRVPKQRNLEALSCHLPDTVQPEPLSVASSRRSTSSSETLRSSSSATPAKRPLGSTLEVRLFVSKIAKTSAGQTTSEGAVKPDIRRVTPELSIVSDLPHVSI